MVRKVMMARPAKRTAGAKPALDSIEEETLKRVGHTVSTLASFLSKWDASGARPEGIIPQVLKIRKFHGQLLGWQKEALRAQGKGGAESQLKRLRSFVALCRTYS
jgi:hypothetical protein